MRTFQLLVIGTAIYLLLSTIICDRVDIEGEEAAKCQRFHSVDRIGGEFEFATVLGVWSKVSPIDIVQLLLKLDFDGDGRRTGRAWNPDMICSLVDDAKSWLKRIAFLIERNHLHDVRVANADSSGVRQRDDMMVIVRLTNQWDHLQDVVVKHENDESACLAQEHWVRRLLLIVQNLLTDIAARNNFDLIVLLGVA